MAWLTTLPGISFGVAGDRFVFLEIRRDRYLALAGSAADQLGEILRRGGEVDPNATATINLLRSGLFELAEEPRPLSAIARPPAAVGLPDRPRAQRTRALDVLAVGDITARARRQLQRAPLATLVGDPCQSGSEDCQRPPDPGFVERAMRFRDARKMVPIATRCLHDSLALKAWLSRAGMASTLVFAVRLEPFAAHCWIEAAGRVLSDEPERIETFVPVGLFR